MQNRSASATQGFKGSLNQFRAGLGQHLNGDVIRHTIFFNQTTHKIKVWLGSSRKSDLDLFEPDFNQQFKHLLFLFNRHWLNQSLVAVPKIDTAPDRRRFYNLIRPGSVAQRNRLKRFVFTVIKSVVWHRDLSLIPDQKCSARIKTTYPGAIQRRLSDSMFSGTSAVTPLPD